MIFSEKFKTKTEYVRLVGDERRTGETLADVSRSWQGKGERFLFVSPHDDDVLLGAGLFMQLAVKENVPVYIMVVTDGSMGYCDENEKNSIAELRKQETYECYMSLGIPRENIIWLGFQDCRLNSCQGRRFDEGEMSLKGAEGLQNSFTYWIRNIAPTQCFLPTSSDIHPDHKIVHQEFLISLFHAAGDIWPELGKPISKVPYVHEMGVYCDFPEPPHLRVKAPFSLLEKKLQAVEMFKSQKQISSLIEIAENSGPYEYLRELKYKLYHPEAYYAMFERSHHYYLQRQR
ncbi:bacillithiol biosynthesis deacetylase BshB1 [Sedimentisphaera cyanobacteriorum]|uniref:Bacillithiol biosynthesis deacetylase BshB1 n=1 Tax=Sedimentisphaera cyanobacteriorum TaxID=1940790 RepID=A0A1Q2HP33_9BACT|nr:PIG-L family deacetylase [Sedimentisphaera cyanobacteriorum]AQQ09219.1 bacillithiol biosynthesis deacetylase BshB1 [Sedimentisphaera cyanobacteriorum]